MKKLHGLYLVLLIAGAVLFVALSQHREEKRSSTASPPEQSPRPSQRRRGVRIAGHVQEPNGRPVKGATVFVLPKEKRGAERDDLRHEVTGADGRWALWARKTVGCWIGVVAPGYRNAYLDGDTVDAAVQMFLVVKRAPPLEIQLRDADGNPLPNQGVELDPWPPADFYFLPGPEARQGEQWAVTDERGVARFRLGTPGPVRITPQLEGLHTHPASTWLAGARGKVTIDVHESTTLEVALTEAQGDGDGASAGAPIAGVVTVDLFDTDSGQELASYTEMTDAPGVLRIERALAPGRYDVHISSPGYRTRILRDQEVPEHPEQARLQATLLPAQEAGLLRVRLEGLGRTESARGRRRAPLTYLLRDEDGWRRLGWQPGAPEEWNRGERMLTYALPPGTYHLLVADVLTGRAALVRGLEITAGGHTDRELKLLPGIQPTLPALGVDGRHARTLRVGTSAWPSLPVYGSTPTARARMGNFLDCISRQDCGESVRLGPYPAAEITLEVVDWSDAVQTHTLK